MKDPKNKKSIDNWKTRLIIISIILTLWGLSWILLGTNFCSYETRGQFGDMFGAVNALFSGFAFAGIIYTILLQREDLNRQNREFKQQNDTMNIQRFESTFFNMLSIFQRITDDLEVSMPEYDLKGEMIDRLKLSGKECFKIVKEVTHEPNGEFKSLAAASSNYYYHEMQTAFESYNTLLTIILEYIDNATLSENDEESIRRKQTYFNLVLQPMTLQQKILFVFHVALCREDTNPYHPVAKELVRKYKFFKDLHLQERITTTFDQNVLVEAGIYDCSSYVRT